MSDLESDPNPPLAVPLSYEHPDLERPASAAPTEAQLEYETPGGIRAGGHDPYAALRLRDYRLYSAGWVLSVIGQQIQDVAVGWDVYHRTKAESGLNPLLALGLVGAVLALPVMLLALPAGALADHFDRRKILMGSMAGAAAAALGLAWLAHTHGSLGMTYLCLFLGATALAFGWPARSALLPQIVPAEVFSNAATWNSSAFQVAAMLGPAIGGAILIYSTAWAYLWDAVLSMVFFVFLMALRVRPSPRAKEPLTFGSLAAGVRFVFRTKIILATITLDLFAVLFGGATSLIPAFAKEILHVGPVGFGVLRAAPAVGALGMALWMAHRPPMKRAGRSLLWAVAGFGLATIVFGLSRSFTLSLLMLVLTGAFDNISVVVRHTLVQMLTPDSMRGRVSAVNNVFIGASNELGGFESGVTGAMIGAVWSVVLGGIGTLAVVWGVAMIWPQIARFGSLQDARPMEENEEEICPPGQPQTQS
ncbi:MAG: putative integral rane efflux protein [Phycisphaerales bacterium]|nr:putative integral rane efflux protein [Phycisphaerales bacterium]